VVFGCTVLLGDLESDKQVRYKIVGADEADIKNGRISINSPVAKALIGKKVGDVVTVVVPSGKKEFEILEISAD
jgi:transcription elongation factor GreA